MSNGAAPTLPLDSLTRGGSLCRKLRSKSMFIDAEPDPSVPSMRSGFVWCAHSLNCLGPDGKVAGEETCRPGRSCYEP